MTMNNKKSEARQINEYREISRTEPIIKIRLAHVNIHTYNKIII